MAIEPQQAMENEQKPHLLRRSGLLQATALNMSNMIGIGLFITIPLLMRRLVNHKRCWDGLLPL